MSTTTRLEYPHELKEQAETILENLTPPPPPLRLLHGVLRVGRTRVSLDTVIYAFNKGCSPRVILRKYPSLELADIYSTIAYYLWNKEMIDAYLEAREKHAEEVRREIEALWPKEGIKERLLARRAAVRVSGRG